MTYTFWSSNTGDGPTPVPPGGTGNSLRFRAETNSQTITCSRSVPSNGSRSWTWSGWVKLGSRGTCTLFTPRIVTAASGSVSSGLWVGLGSKLWFQTYGTNQSDSWRSYGNLGDPNAWYHIVFTCDVENNQTNGYINGVKAGDTNVVNSDYMSFDDTMGFRYGGSNYGTAWGDFYASDVYLIDGQVLLPTAFGRYNEDGVWVPREVDFTPAQMRYSDYLTSPDVGFQSAHPPAYAFNGLSSDYCITQTNGTWVFAPTTPIPVTSTVEVFQFNTAGQTSWNGSTFTPNGGSVTFSGSGEISASNPITGTSVGTGQASFLNKIVVDGVELVNPYLYSFDVTLIGAGAEGGFASSPYFMFDGNTATTCDAAASNQSIKWVPSTPITYNTKIEYFTPGPADTNLGFLYYQGTELAVVNNLSGEWTTLIEGSGTFDDLRINGVNATAQCAAIRIDGEIYVDGSNPSYGAAGFHLTFEDPNNVGLDSSGNGNNFTATGFETIPPKNPQWQTYAENWGTAYTNQPSAVFSGAATASFESYDWYFLQPSTATLTGVLQQAGVKAGDVIRFTVYPRTGSITCDISGTSGSASGNTGAPHTVDVTVPAQGVTSCTITGTDPTYWGIGAISVNGAMLTNSGSGSNYDLMQDSPTKNYAMLNPIVGGTSNGTLGLTNANLGFKLASSSTLGYYRPTYGTIPIPSTGQWYWEVTVGPAAPEDPNNGMPKMGITSFPFPEETGNTIVGTTAMMGADGYAFRYGGSGYDPYGPTQGANAIPVGNVLGFAYNANNGEFRAYNNGVDMGLMDTVPTDLQWYTVMTGIYAGSGPTPVNYGQQPFLYTPPEGFSALQTQNLPAVTIPDGRNHFQAITGGGSGALLYEENSANTSVTSPFDPISNGTGFPFNGFSPQWVIDFGQAQDSVSTTHGGAAGLTCCLSEDGNTWTVFSTNFTLPSGSAATFTTADNGGNQIRFVRFFAAGGFSIAWQSTPSGVPILQAAQDVFDTGLWWIKSRTNSGNHQLLDSIRGGDLALTLPDKGKQAEYGVPGGNCVAWTWNLDANRSNGFDIITWTGDTVDGRQIPHNLDASRPLDMVIVKGYDAPDTSTYIDAANWVTWHNAFPVNGFAYLNTNGQAGTTNSFWTATGPNSVLGNLTIGSDPDVNNGPDVRGGAIEYVAYLWQSIPGYSAFGQYTANGTTDNAFCYCGFRPAVLIIKRFNGTGDWSIVDTTRDIDNPVLNQLRLNLADPERQYDSGGLDILSNGFKIRQGGSMIGDSGNQYVWAAFAENPFGSSNVSPANAR